MVNLQHSLLVRKAGAALSAGQLHDARRFCDAVLRQQRDEPAALFQLAQITWEEAEHDEAISILKRLIAKHPKFTPGRLLLGRFLTDRGRFREAMTQFERVMKANRDHPDAIAGLAHALEMRGDHGRARERLEPFIRSGTETPEMARVHARIAMHEGNYSDVVAIADRHSTDEAASLFQRSQLLYLAGQALEKSGDFQRSFAAYREANELRRGEFDPQAEAAEIDATIEAYSREMLNALPRAQTDSSQLVFIVSRPRSGGTLVERILSAHPDVVAAGEVPLLVKIAADMGFQISSTMAYPRCIADLDQDDVNRLSQSYLDAMGKLARRAKRVTDKHLYTWRHVGLIELLFPKARIIDLRRNAVDNCLACYMAPLGRRFPFSHDLTHLGLSHRQYQRLMEHWHAVCQVPMLSLQYEELVNDPENWTRRLVEFCGLPWDESCVRFHEQKSQWNPTAAPTLSHDQVRQPIYTSSVGRAAQFEAFIEPLRSALDQ